MSSANFQQRTSTPISAFGASMHFSRNIHFSSKVFSDNVSNGPVYISSTPLRLVSNSASAGNGSVRPAISKLLSTVAQYLGTARSGMTVACAMDKPPKTAIESGAWMRIACENLPRDDETVRILQNHAEALLKAIRTCGEIRATSGGNSNAYYEAYFSELLNPMFTLWRPEILHSVHTIRGNAQLLNNCGGIASDVSHAQKFSQFTLALDIADRIAISGGPLRASIDSLERVIRTAYESIYSFTPENHRQIRNCLPGFFSFKQMEGHIGRLATLFSILLDVTWLIHNFPDMKKGSCLFEHPIKVEIISLWSLQRSGWAQTLINEPKEIQILRFYLRNRNLQLPPNSLSTARCQCHRNKCIWAIQQSIGISCPPSKPCMKFLALFKALGRNFGTTFHYYSPLMAISPCWLYRPERSVDPSPMFEPNRYIFGSGSQLASLWRVTCLRWTRWMENRREEISKDLEQLDKEVKSNETMMQSHRYMYEREPYPLRYPLTRMIQSNVALPAAYYKGIDAGLDTAPASTISGFICCREHRRNAEITERGNDALRRQGYHSVPAPGNRWRSRLAEGDRQVATTVSIARWARLRTGFRFGPDARQRPIWASPLKTVLWFEYYKSADDLFRKAMGREALQREELQRALMQRVQSAAQAGGSDEDEDEDMHDAPDEHDDSDDKTDEDEEMEDAPASDTESVNSMDTVL